MSTTHSIPAMMPAVGYLQSLPVSDDEALVDLALPVPTPGPYDLLVKVEAIAANPVDYKIRQRRAPQSKDGVVSAEVLGWDATGVVVAAGAAVQHYQVGDAVFYAGALNRPGANSAYHLVDERLVGPKPQSLSFADAAALPLTAITAWELLFDRLQLDKPAPQFSRKVLLVSGAAGGVGSVLVQLAKLKTDAFVIATASRPESQAWVSALGADAVINHQLPLADELKRIGIDAVSHVVSLVDTAAYYQQFIDVLAPQGKLALIDDPVEALDIRPLKLKSLSLHWELMFTRSLFQTPDQIAQHQLLNQLSTLVEQGKINSTQGELLGKINAANLRRAHQQLESGQTIGKLVLAGF